MIKFWEWMEVKNYTCLYDNDAEYPETSESVYFDIDGGSCHVDDCDFSTNIEFKIPKQMLIGYMIEYLIEKSKVKFIDISWSGETDIDIIYETFREKIEEIE